MKKQTAVEWLKKELEEYGSSSHLSLDWETFDELCEQAKQMEKEQTCTSNQVPFYETCYCNPKNGGSGICGCTISNKIVYGK